MLDVVETLVAEALRAALPAGTAISSGAVVAATAPDPSVAVEATRLAVRLPPSADAARDRREPPQPLRRYDLGPHPGTQVALGLPQAASGPVVEVQCPPGRRLPNDAYVVEGRSLHLLGEGSGTVIALLRGDTADGYREIQRCRLQLSLVVRATQAERASRLIAPALAATLAAVAGRDVIDLHRRDDGRFAIRLLRPVAQLQSITQAIEENAGKARHRRQADLILRAELELLLATGDVPEAGGIIRQVELELLRGRRPE